MSNALSLSILSTCAEKPISISEVCVAVDRCAVDTSRAMGRLVAKNHLEVIAKGVYKITPLGRISLEGLGQKMGKQVVVKESRAIEYIRAPRNREMIQLMKSKGYVNINFVAESIDLDPKAIDIRFKSLMEMGFVERKKERCESGLYVYGLTQKGVDATDPLKYIDFSSIPRSIFDLGHMASKGQPTTHC